jgi:hypothetical protein
MQQDNVIIYGRLKKNIFSLSKKMAISSSKLDPIMLRREGQVKILTTNLKAIHRLVS